MSPRQISSAHDRGRPALLCRVEHGERGLTRVALHGELDLGGASRLEATLHDLARQACQLVLDLRGVTFIDSYGLRALVSTHGVVAAGSGAFNIIAASPQVKRPFAVTGLDLAYLWPSERH